MGIPGAVGWVREDQPRRGPRSKHCRLVRQLLALSSLVAGCILFVVAGHMPAALADDIALACTSGQQPAQVSSVSVDTDTSLAGVHFAVRARSGPGAPAVQQVFDTGDPAAMSKLLLIAGTAILNPNGYASPGMDVDGDGTPDYAWTLRSGASMESNDAGAVYHDQLGMPFQLPAFPLFRSYGGLRLGVHRLTKGSGLADPDVAPAEFDFVVTVDLKDGNQALVGQKEVSIGVDGRAASLPIGDATVEVNVGVDPATKRLAVVYRESHSYYLGNDATHQLSPAEAGDPPVSTFATVAEADGAMPTDPSQSGPNDIFHAAMAWTGAPSEFAMGALVDCGGTTAHNRIAWDHAPGAPNSPANLDVDVAAGAGTGLSYPAGSQTVTLPTVGLKARVTAVPDRLVGDLGPSIVLTQNGRPDSSTPAPPSQPAPSLELQQLVLGAKSATPGVVDQPTVVRGRIDAMPPVTTADIGLTPQGSFSSADVRFCSGAWDSTDCSQTLVAAGNVSLEIGNVPDGLANTLPPSVGTGPFVYYGARETATYGAAPNLESPPPLLAAESTWRIAASMPGVRHVRVSRDATTGGLAGSAETAGAEAATVLMDDDGRRTTVDPGPKPTSKTTGSDIGIRGRLSPLPPNVSFGLSPTQWIPVDLSFNFGGAKPTLLLEDVHRYGNSDDDFLAVEGKAQFGEDNMAVSSVRLQYEPAGAPSGNPWLPETTDSQLAYFADSFAAVKLDLSISTATERSPSTNRRLHMFADAILGPKVAVAIGTDSGGLSDASIAPSQCVLGFPCPPTTSDPAPVLRSGHVRAVYEEIPLQLPQPICMNGCPESWLWTMPAMPARQFPLAYPTFGANTHGLTYVARDDNLWGVDLVLGNLGSAALQMPSGGPSATVCLTGTADANDFGVKVFQNTHAAGSAPKPFYVDGELSRLPDTLALRLTPQATAGKSWVAFNSKSCDTTSMPSSIGNQSGGPELRALVKAGDAGTQTVAAAMTTPAGTPFPLIRPVQGGTVGLAARILSDDLTSGTAIDAAVSTTLPEQMVVMAPSVTNCPTDWLSARSCSGKPPTELDDVTSIKFGYRSRVRQLGPFDAVVRLRHLRSSVSPAPDNTCAGDTCSFDVTAHLDNLTGQADGQFSLVRNRRIPQVHLGFSFKSLWFLPAVGDRIENLDVTVRDDAAPACVGSRSAALCNSTSGVPYPSRRTDNYSAHLHNVDSWMNANLDFQGTESDGLANKAQGMCQDAPTSMISPHKFRGTLGLGYVHADVTMGNYAAHDVTVKTRIDAMGRARAEVDGDGPLAGTVDAKIVNFGVSPAIDQYIAAVMGSIHVRGCLDADIPIRLDFGAKQVYVTLDKFHGMVRTSDGYGSARIKIGEQIDGQWVDGVYWDVNRMQVSATGDLLKALNSMFGDIFGAVGRNWQRVVKPIDFLGVPFWHASTAMMDVNYTFFDYSKTNSIGTNETLYGYPDGELWPCCANLGVVDFMIDPLLTSMQRSALAGLTIDLFGTNVAPGFYLYNTLYQMGSQAGAGSVTIGDPHKTPAATGSIDWDVSSILPHLQAENEAYATASPDIAVGPDGTRYQLTFGVHWPRNTAGPYVKYDLGGWPYYDDVDQATVDACKSALDTWSGVYWLGGGPLSPQCLNTVSPVLSLQALYPNGEVRWVKPLSDTGAYIRTVYSGGYYNQEVVPGARPFQAAELAGCGFKWQCRVSGSAKFTDGGHLDLTFQVKRNVKGVWKLSPYSTDICNNNMYTYRFAFDPSGVGGQTGFGSVSFDPAKTVISFSGTAEASTKLAVNTTSSSWWNGCLFPLQKTRKVWYFGDGTSQEVTNGSATLGASVPSVTHKYATPGKYPAMLVYYVYDPSVLTYGLTADWKPIRWVPVNVTVNAPSQ